MTCLDGCRGVLKGFDGFRWDWRVLQWFQGDWEWFGEDYTCLEGFREIWRRAEVFRDV